MAQQPAQPDAPYGAPVSGTLDGWTRSGASPASRSSESDLPNSDEVFISYSHDAPAHVDAVLALSNRLRAEGFDAVLDQYEASPPGGLASVDGPQDSRKQVRDHGLHRDIPKACHG